MEIIGRKVNGENNFENILFSIFSFFCFFPYINILRVPTDAQPNALIFAIILFCIGLKRYKYPKIAFSILFLMIPIYLIGSVNSSQIDFSFFRSLLGYLSLFFITIISYVYFKRGNFISWIQFRNFLYINVFVSILQAVLKVNFVEFLFYRVGTSDTRGVTGLTPEPTFNATIAIFFACLYLMNYYHKRRNYILLIICFWIVFLAQSSTIVLMAVPVVFLYLIFKKPKIFIFPIVIIGISLAVFLKSKETDPESSRLISVLQAVKSDPGNLIMLDESVNQRISNIIGPSYVSLLEFTAPHGSDMRGFVEKIPKVIAKDFPNLFYFDDITKIQRIMSGWAMMFYEVGFISFLFFLYLIYLLFFKFKGFGLDFLGALLFISIVFTAVTINTSMIPFIFGNIIFRAININKKRLYEQG